MNLEDLLGNIHSAFGYSGEDHQPRKGKDQVIPLEVTLEDLYKGKKTTVKVTKKIVCVTCDGRGGKEGAKHKCKNCDGHGQVIMVRRIGPSVAQRFQVECDKCSGLGKVVADKDKCSKCNGHGITKEQKSLEVNVTPGMQDGQKISFSSEGDQEPGIARAGDAIVVLQAKPHKEFERHGNDLITKRTITLAEALCGLSMNITHLDGRTFLFTTEPGKVIKHSSTSPVSGEGMPIQGSKERGNLYVYFDVSFPKSLSKDACKKLEGLLERRPVESLPVTGHKVEEVSLSRFDSSRYGRSESPFDEDDGSSEETGHPQQQCAAL